MVPGNGVNQLSGYPDPITGTSDAALQYVPNTEFAANLPQVSCLSLVNKTGVARDHEQRRNIGQSGDDVFGNAVRKISLFRITAHIVERQNSDRGLLGKLKRPLANPRRSSESRLPQA